MHRPYPRETSQTELLYIGFEEPANGLGTAGFLVSLVGLIVTLGILCPVGVLLSLVGLMNRPRHLAVAGLLIGLVGMSLPIGGAYYLHHKREAELRMQLAEETTEIVLVQATREIENLAARAGGLPEGIAGNKIALRYRDGWRRELRYDRFDNRFLVRSAGPDGKFETEDDLVRQPVR